METDEYITGRIYFWKNWPKLFSIGVYDTNVTEHYFGVSSVWEIQDPHNDDNDEYRLGCYFAVF
jgi:hypothetical protein